MKPSNCLKCPFVDVDRIAGFTQVRIYCQHPKTVDSYALAGNIRFAKQTTARVNAPVWCPERPAAFGLERQ